ncbi:MAG: hypothetical protein J6L81_06955, partial [Clostridia bacterium]|nr:hypothetical protein [Clostridia bacterium]
MKIVKETKSEAKSFEPSDFREVISATLPKRNKKPIRMHRTLKDNNLKVRALRRARELREVS